MGASCASTTSPVTLITPCIRLLPGWLDQTHCHFSERLPLQVIMDFRQHAAGARRWILDFVLGMSCLLLSLAWTGIVYGATYA